MSRRIYNPEINASVARARQAVARQKQPQAYGVGGSCGTGPRPPNPCGPAWWAGGDRFCFKGGKRLCDLRKISQSVTVAGGSPFNLQLEPQLSPYFEPIAARMVVTDNANSNLNYRVLITAVQINSIPQEAINNSAPTTATTAGYWSDDYQDPDLYAIPVGWGVLGKAAQALQLNMYGVARGYDAGVTLWITLTVYGNPMSQLPDGCDCGLPVPEKPNGSGVVTPAGTPVPSVY